MNTALKATGNTSGLEKIYLVYLWGEEKSVSTGKLFQMITTRSVKNEEQAVQLECCSYSL